MNSRRLKRNRWLAWRRQKGRCYWCGERLGLHQVTADHLLPKVHGSTIAASNIVAACEGCNSRRGSSLVAAVAAGGNGA